MMSKVTVPASFDSGPAPAEGEPVRHGLWTADTENLDPHAEPTATHRANHDARLREYAAGREYTVLREEAVLVDQYRYRIGDDAPDLFGLAPSVPTALELRTVFVFGDA